MSSSSKTLIYVLALLPIQLAYADHTVVDTEQLPTVTVTGTRTFEEQHSTPATSASVTAEELADTNNVVNTEDALKYLPSVFVRKRYIGDTNAPVATRTTGINASARSLIYADGLLLSSLIANNNGNGSPQWFLVAPNEIEQVDVLYGPYSAAYPGNSYGAVINITTRMPTHFEADGKISGSLQSFKQYGTDSNYGGYELSAGLGDHRGPFSWRLSFNHLDSQSQPVTYLTTNQSANAATGAEPVISGAYADRNKTGGAIQVLGAGNLTHTLQDNLTFKLAYDINDTLRLAYTLGYWQNDANAHPESYLRDATGNAYFGASNSNLVNINGFTYKNNAIVGLYSSNEAIQVHLAQALSLKSNTQGEWDWSVIGSYFDYIRDKTLSSSGAFPAAQSGGPGKFSDASGTGWSTLDASAVWRPQGIDGNHFVSFGVHGDHYTLDTLTYSSNDWHAGDQAALSSSAAGDTETGAFWLQELWRVTPAVTATLGGRYEFWRAYNGQNVIGSNIANQPSLNKSGFSPKLSVSWDIDKNWQLTSSTGRALRFPTVGELYQYVQVGTTLTLPNAKLKPEDVISTELAAEFHSKYGKVRAVVFQENVKDMLIAQNSMAPNGVVSSFTQNVDRTRQRGVELSAEERDLLLKGLELSGSVTYVDGRITKNDSYVAPTTTPGATSVGKRTPYIPLWRATLVSTYRPNEQLAFTLAGRYSQRLYSTVDGSDINTHTYQGFDGFVVADARVNYRVTRQWGLAAGVNNFTNREYFLFHPFEQRTFFAELKFDTSTATQ